MTPTQTSSVPKITLNNGVELPAAGYGVFQTAPQETVHAVLDALLIGYRHIDTAAAYGNEREVGDAIRRSGVDRPEVFIETKVWISDYGYEATRHAFDKSAAKLGMDQLDLLILHQPLPTSFDRTIGAYKALESLLADGKVRAIGVSNFMPDHLDRLLPEVSVVPAVNQIDVHPYFRQTDVLAKNAGHGILSQAWSPIGGITFYPSRGDKRKSTLEEPVLLSIGKAHDKSAAQVMLRWHLQQCRSAIPKSIKPARIAENFDIFDFTLSNEELAAIDALDTGVRGGTLRRSRSSNTDVLSRRRKRLSDQVYRRCPAHGTGRQRHHPQRLPDAWRSDRCVLVWRLEFPGFSGDALERACESIRIALD